MQGPVHGAEALLLLPLPGLVVIAS